MAENTQKKTTEKITIPKPAGANEKAKVIGLNGVMYTVPYGIETEVPVGVAEIAKRFLKNEAKAEAESERIAAGK